MDWQPIETAPKDGATVIVWDGEKVTPAYFDGAWWEERERYNQDAIDMAPSPTHWMPLPDPPA